MGAREKTISVSTLVARGFEVLKDGRAGRWKAMHLSLTSGGQVWAKQQCTRHQPQPTLGEEPISLSQHITAQP